MAIEYNVMDEGLAILSGGVEIEILVGSNDPSSGAGQVANIGALFLRDDGTSFKKTGVADTAWELQPDGSVVTDLSALSAAIDANSADILIISGDIATLSGAIDTNTTNIGTISGDLITVEGDIVNLSGAIDTNTGDILDIQNDLTSGFVTIDTNQTVSGEKTFVEDMTILANLTVSGSLTSVESENLVITDNVITINNGETGAGVTLGTAGIEVDRGTENNVLLRWNETSDTWQITFDGITYYDILTTADNIDVDIAALSSAIDQNSTDITNISGVIGVLSGGNYIIGTEVATDLVQLDNNLFTVSGDLDALEVIVGAPLSAGNVIQGNTIAEDLVFLDNIVAGSVALTAELNGVPASTITVLDSSPSVDFENIGWRVTKTLDADTTRKRSWRVDSTFDGSATVDFNRVNILTLGGNYNGRPSVQVSGGFIQLVVESTLVTSWKSQRLYNY